jgi:hypothetical protein
MGEGCLEGEFLMAEPEGVARYYISSFLNQNFFKMGLNFSLDVSQYIQVKNPQKIK